ncbi:hypothetical protein LKM13_11710 [Bacillus anthracis]|nr:hypothetical protein [Bacillus anthracis]
MNTATNTVIDMVPVDIAPTGIATGTIFLCSLHTSHS